MSFVKRLTGPGVTESVNMVSADLGVARWDAKRKANAVIFGDNFAERFMTGEWQSPSIVMYNNEFDVLGVPAGTTDIISSGNRRQTLAYDHNAGGISTILPCDFIHIGGRWVMAVMIVGMGGLGDEKATQFFESPDLIKWTKTSVSLEHPGHPGNVMLTFDRVGDWVYIFGTGGLARNRPIWLWRNRASEFPLGYWEPWGLDNVGWAWGNANERTPLLAGNYGELCFRYIQGNSVLSFFDVDRYACSALTVVEPTDYWPGAHRTDFAFGSEYPQLYGGYISPDSRLNTPNGMKFLVSQWNTQTNDPYHVIRVDDTLQAQGPLIGEPGEPVEPAPPKPPEVPVPSTPQETYELLLRELAASGSTEITTADGTKLTLREAVGEIYAQECSLQNLRGNWLNPRLSVPQLDHILSARYEGLLSQDLIIAIADKLDVDVGAVLHQTREVIE